MVLQHCCYVIQCCGVNHSKESAPSKCWNWFEPYVTAAMLGDKNKRSLISSFCSSIIIFVSGDWLQTIYTLIDWAASFNLILMATTEKLNQFLGHLLGFVPVPLSSPTTMGDERRPGWVSCCGGVYPENEKKGKLVRIYNRSYGILYTINTLCIVCDQ